MLISRNYRGDIDMAVIDKFMPLVMEKEEDSNLTPIISHGNVTFVYIKYNNLYLVSTTKKNANVAMVFSFLHKLVQVCGSGDGVGCGSVGGGGGCVCVCVCVRIHVCVCVCVCA